MSTVRKLILGFVLIAGAVTAYLLWGREATSPKKSQTQNSQSSGSQGAPVNTKNDAIALARAQCKGIEMPQGSPATVTESETTYVVTFPIARAEPRPGPDYYARVTIAKENGEVLETLVGS